MLLFGAAQVLLSQIPDFNSIKFLSVVAAVMSFTYSFIVFALGFAEVIGRMVNQLQISCLFIGFPYVYHIIFTSLQNYRKWICQGQHHWILNSQCSWYISSSWRYRICISMFPYPYQNPGLNPDSEQASFVLKHNMIQFCDPVRQLYR